MSGLSGPSSTYDPAVYGIGVGPTNIVRRAEERNEFIPCPFIAPYYPTWKINEEIFELSSLPEDFVPTTHGLLIPTLNKEMNGTKFQCFIRADPNYGTQSSTVGILIVG